MKDPPRNLGKGAERASFWRAKRVAAPCLTVVKGDGTYRVPDGRKVGGTRRTRNGRRGASPCSGRRLAAPGHYGALHRRLRGGGGRGPAAGTALPAAVCAAEPRERAAQVRGRGAERAAEMALGPARAHRPPLPAAPSSSACPTPRSATWLWRFSTAPCSRSCRDCWRSSTSPKRACTTSACGCRMSTEVRGGGGTTHAFPPGV